MEAILDSCHCLQKLSMGRMSDNDVLPLNLSIFYRICLQNGKSLKVLNLPNCKGMDVKSLKMIVDHCESLIEVDFAGTELSEESFNFLCENLSIDIEKLCLRGQNFYHEDNYEKIIKRCSRLKRLELNYTKPWTEQAKYFTAYISEYLKESLETIYMPPKDYISITEVERIIFDLRSMSKLKVLRHNLHMSPVMSILKQALPHLNIQHDDGPHMSTKWLYHRIWDIKANQANLFETYKSFAGLTFYYGTWTITYHGKTRICVNND